MAAPRAALAAVLATLFSAATVSGEGCRLGSPAEPSRFERVPENLQPGTHVLVFEAEGAAELELRPVNKEEDYTDYFRPVLLTNDTGGLVVSQPLTSLVRRQQPVSVAKFRVFCASRPPFTGSDSLLVSLYIEDVNDHPPVFVGAPYQVTVDELTPPGIVVFDGIIAEDNDKPNTANSDIYYWISRGNENLKFSLSPLPNGGAAVVLEKPLDFEDGDRELNLTITASDRGAPARLSRAQLTVSVRDSDDQPPVFTAPVYRASVTEYPGTQMRTLDLPLRTEPAILAYDADLAIDQPLQYGIASGNSGGHFSIDRETGRLTLVRTFDRERLDQDEVSLMIEAWQTDDRSRSARAEVKVKVTDLNDNRPDFAVDRYNISIIENLLRGFSIVQVQATDPDEGDNARFTYRLEDRSGAFGLDPTSGWLTVADQTRLDRETRPLLQLDIFADELRPNVLDERGEVKSMTSVMINLLDSNDNNPQFEPTNTYQFVVEGNSSVGSVIGQVSATDPDEAGNGRVRFSFENSTLADGGAAFSVSAESGELVQRRPLPAGPYVLFVRAEDSPESRGQTRSALAVVTVLVRPRNVRPPSVSAGQRLWVGKDVAPGSRLGQLIAGDPDGDSLTFRLRNGTELFEMEEGTGVIRVVSPLNDTAQTKYTLGVDVTDGTHLTAAAIDIIIVPENAEEAFESASYSFEVEENLSNLTIGSLLNGTSATEDLLEAKILNPSLNETFEVTEKGELRLLKPLDFESDRQLSFTAVLQYRRRGQRYVRAAGVTIRVRDTNDNGPRFSSRRYRGTVPAGAIAGTLLAVTPEVRVSDPDRVRSRLRFQLSGCGQTFHVSALALVSVGEQRFDRARYDCELEVLDEEGRRDSSSLEVRVMGWGAAAETSSALTGRSTSGASEGADSGSSTSSTQSDPADGDPLRLDSIVEREDFQSRALTGPDRVLTQLLGSTSEANASFVPRATIRIPAGLPVGSRIYQIPESILPQRQRRINLIEIWPGDRATKTKTAEPEWSNTGEKHFAVQWSSDGAALLLDEPLTAPGPVVLRLRTEEKGVSKDLLALLVDVVAVPRPQLRQAEVAVSLDEGEYTDEEVGTIQLAGPPQGRGSVRFSIADGNTAHRVSQEGVVFVSGSLDFERRRRVPVAVLVCPQLCTDLASALPLTDSVQEACQHTCAEGAVTISLRDVNDNPPQFLFVSEIVTAKRGIQNEPELPYAAYKLRTPAVLEEGTVVLNTTTYDADTSNGEVRFQMITPDESFAIDSESGVLRTTKRTSFGARTPRQLVIAAYDPARPGLRSMALLELAPADVEDVRPARALDSTLYSVEVPENSVVARLPVPWTLTESAPRPPHRWTLRTVGDPAPGFSAAVADDMLELTGAIDFEERQQVWLLVTLESGDQPPLDQSPAEGQTANSSWSAVPDLGYRTARRLGSLPFPPRGPAPSPETLLYNQALLRVDVTDVNDHAPRLNVSRLAGVVGVPYDAGYGFTLVTLQASDQDHGDNVTFHLNSSSTDVQTTFSVEPLTGEVRLLRRADVSTQRLHRLGLVARDTANHSDSVTLLVYVLDSRDMLVVKLNRTAAHVQQHRLSIARGLSTLAAADVRVLRVSPHSDGELVDDSHSDVWLYALEPATSTLLSAQQLMARLESAAPEVSGGSQPGVHVAGMWPATEPPRGFFTNLKFIIVGLSLAIFLLMVATLAVLCSKSCKRDRKTSPYPPLTLTPAASGYSGTPPPSDVTQMTSHQPREMVERRRSPPAQRAPGAPLGLVLEPPLYSKPSRRLAATQVSPGHYVADPKQMSQTVARRRRDPGQGQGQGVSHVRYGSLNYPRAGRAANQLAALLTPERPLAGANVRRQSVTNSMGDGTEVGVATMSFYSESPSDMPPVDFGPGFRLRLDPSVTSPPRPGDERRFADPSAAHPETSTGHLRTNSSDARGEEFLDSLEPGQFPRTWSVKQ